MTDDLRIAVVGAGYWGRNLVRVFHELGVLDTVCDQSPEVGAAAVEGRSGVRVEPSFDTVLADPSIDAVAIATPAITHGEMVEAALMAGKDVYVEKPLCLSTRQGESLEALSQSRDRILMVGHLLWYHPVVLKLKSMVDNGELGRIQYIYSNRLNLGKLRREENVLWSFAPHDVSVILGLVGELPASVQAHGGSFLHEQVADTTVSMFTFSSGLRAHIFVSWLHPYKEQKLVVVGDRQMAVFDDTAAWPEKLQIYPHTVEWRGNVPIAQKGEAHRVDVPEDEPLRAECEHFLSCVRSRTTPRTNGKEGVRVLSVLNACQKALQEGSVVELVTPESTESYFAHETAVIDAGASVGKGSKVWHFSHILPGSVVGENCNIGQNVVIGPNVTIDANCKIQNNVSVYEGVSLEADVFCGPSMVFTNVINPRAQVSRKDEYRPTIVRRGATIGANATVVCGSELGSWCFVGAGAVVTRDVPPHALVVGNPARQVGWMGRCGQRLREDLSCPCGQEKYRQTESGVEAVAD